MIEPTRITSAARRCAVSCAGFIERVRVLLGCGQALDFDARAAHRSARALRSAEVATTRSLAWARMYPAPSRGRAPGSAGAYERLVGKSTSAHAGTPLRTSTTCDTRQSAAIDRQAVRFIPIHRHHLLRREPVHHLAHRIVIATFRSSFIPVVIQCVRVSMKGHRGFISLRTIGCSLISLYEHSSGGQVTSPLPWRQCESRFQIKRALQEHRDEES